ncbi:MULTISPECIES: XRE family transcriptional regulator [Burkholderia cepacia complex]|uniref:XRE family transcriptional regulator n=1 Tax=Burkholderia cepacia complex TaxID=87882 RepID=UPI0009BD1257|nr:MULTISPECIES: XRE family transcriptional regulator [Burkholderia cepacia complex]MDN7681563.1 XRE family transcriptional regulator [Burkholderia cenocepacia]
MSSQALITNDRHAREVTGLIDEISRATSSEQMLKSVINGFPPEVLDGIQQALNAERAELTAMLNAYVEAKHGNLDLLKARAQNDLGEMLIVGRIAKGWSQKDLARQIGLREQAVQRYEADRYRSISLAGFVRVARALGVRVSADICANATAPWMSLPSLDVSAEQAQKVLKHARENGWLESTDSDENALSQLVRYVAEHVGSHGKPSLLRTGLVVEHHADDWSLLCWKAQVTRRAKAIIDSQKVKYRPLDMAWLKDLPGLSAIEDGPLLARDLLLAHGIVVVVEPHVPGMKVDGAAFLVDDIPVIGLTLRRDALDNFWFTLLHEVAHVILHYRTGLAAGFFDNSEAREVDEMEMEADKFAGSLLIPQELWLRSPARIAKTADTIERFAQRLCISPAVVFGRIRMERQNYAIFSDKIGSGQVRKLFFQQ